MKFQKDDRNKYAERKPSYYRRRTNCTLSFSLVILIIFLILIQLAFIFLILQFPIFQLREIQNDKEEYVHTFHHLDKETIQEWDEVLRKGEIISTKLFISSQSAISEKFFCILKYNNKLYKTMGKLVENPLYKYSKPNILEEYPTNTTFMRRLSNTREYQGVPEVIAYSMDKILQYDKKPPSITRLINSKKLFSFNSIIPFIFTDYLYYGDYYNNFSYRSIPFKSFDMIYYYLESFKEDYNIYITLTPYLDSIHSVSPSLIIKEYLTKQLPLALDIKLAKHDIYLDIVDTSNILVFDYLMDEHDRKAEKNWIRFDGRFIVWDNGLSFDHGPVNLPPCLDILCGSNLWRKGLTTMDLPCTHINRFSEITYNRLLELSEQNIGELIRNQTTNDIIFPGFHKLLYERFKGDPHPFTFVVDQFWDGFNTKLSSLLSYIQLCIKLYGKHNVLF